uniref:Uncharacterized protein n=1 Tax=Oryza brachyantha TaxID=4533 RepID=J3KUM2_ORYBR
MLNVYLCTCFNYFLGQHIVHLLINKCAHFKCDKKKGGNYLERSRAIVSISDKHRYYR